MRDAGAVTTGLAVCVGMITGITGVSDGTTVGKAVGVVLTPHAEINKQIAPINIAVRLISQSISMNIKLP
jgi:hypothetical protein